MTSYDENSEALVFGAVQIAGGFGDVFPRVFFCFLLASET